MSPISYLATLIAFAIADGIWLTSTSRFYKSQIGFLMSPHVTWWAAVLFYLLYAFGVLFFAIAPALKSTTPLWAVFLTGAFFGLVAYSTYDLTNQATVRDWPTLITLVDLLWGAFATGLVSTVVIFLLRK